MGVDPVVGKAQLERELNPDRDREEELGTAEEDGPMDPEPGRPTCTHRFTQSSDYVYN